MRVALVTRDFPPTTGGVSTVALSLVEALRRQGIEVDVFVGKSNSGTLLLPLRGTIRSSNYDIVSIQSGPFGAFVIGHPYVLSLYSPVSEEAKYYPVQNRLRVLPALLLERASVLRAAAVIASSKYTRELLHGQYGVNPSKIHLIPLGVDLNMFHPAKNEPRGKTRILICSRLDPRKNIAEAVSALSSVGGQSYTLQIVGDGPERRRLEELARSLGPSVTFLGRVPDSMIPRVFSEADVFLTASKSEGFGLSVLQAMASGCAVIASDIPPHRELLKHMETGILFPDRSSLLSALQLLLRDLQLVRKLGREARQRAETFSWDSVAKHTVELFERTLSAGRRV